MVLSFLILNFNCLNHSHEVVRVFVQSITLPKSMVKIEPQPLHPIHRSQNRFPHLPSCIFDVQQKKASHLPMVVDQIYLHHIMHSLTGA